MCARTGIAFLSGNAKLFFVYFDDDSDFSDKNDYAVNGTNKIAEKIYGPEQLDVVQHKLMQKWNASHSTGIADKVYALSTMKNANYTDDIKYHITVKDDNILLEYGPEPRGNIVIRKRPVMIQNSDGRLTGGWIIVKSWL